MKPTRRTGSQASGCYLLTGAILLSMASANLQALEVTGAARAFDGDSRILPSGQSGKAADIAGDKAAFQINFGLSGPWFEPATSGQGFLLDVVPSAQVLSFAWFTFGVAGGAGAPIAQRWLTGAGSYTMDTAETTLFLSEGGAFNAQPAPTSINVGSLRIQFTDCTHAVADYAVRRNAIVGSGDPAAGEMLTGSIQLQRLTPNQTCS